jgi:3-amino-5-hydroxybenzoate synthase
MNEFSASVLRGQLTRLEAQTDLREERARQLTALLAEIPDVLPQGRDERCDRNSHYMAMFQLPGVAEYRRNEIVDRLIVRGLPAFVGFRAIYRTDGFWETGAPDEPVEAIAKRCPVSEALTAQSIWLHHRTLLGTEQQMHDIATIVAQTLAGA